MPSPVRPVLGYAARPARRRSARVAVAVAIAVVSVAAAVGWRPVWRQARVLARQRAFLAYDPPADRIVYSHTARPTEAATPAELARFYADIVPGHDASVPPDRLARVLFAGRLRNAHGSRLVVVELYGHFKRDVPTFVGTAYCRAHVIAPAGLLGRPVEVGCGEVTPTSTAARPGDVIDDGDDVPVTAYAGQADPDAPADFVVGYTVAGDAGTLRGHLGDDDHVTLVDDSPHGGWGRLVLRPVQRVP